MRAALKPTGSTRIAAIATSLLMLAVLCVPTAARASNATVRSASASTAWETAFGPWSVPAAVAVDTSGRVLVLDSAACRVTVLSSFGEVIREWGGRGTGAGRFIAPSAIAVDRTGNVYVADTGNHRIQKFSSSGRYLAKWGSRGTRSGQFSSPAALAVDRSGSVYVADTGNHRVQKFTGSGRFVAKWGARGTGAGRFVSPAGIAVDHLGNVFVADTGNHRVQRFDSRRVYRGRFGGRGTGYGQFISPRALWIDRVGSIYVVDAGNNRVQKFGGTLDWAAAWGDKGSAQGKLLGPRGVAGDTTGERMYVADAGNRRLQVMRSTWYERDDDVIGATAASSWPLMGEITGTLDQRDVYSVNLKKGTKVVFSGPWGVNLRLLPFGASTVEGLPSEYLSSSVTYDVQRSGTYHLVVIGRLFAGGGYTIARTIQTQTKAAILTPKGGAAPVTFGGAVRISGTATTWDGRSGPRVVEVRYTSGDRSWATTAPVVGGRFSTTYRPTGTTSIKVRVPGDGSYLPSALSRPTRIRVAPVLAVSGSKSRSMRAGGYLVLEGTVRPAHSVGQRFLIWGSNGRTGGEINRYAYVVSTSGATGRWRARIRLVSKGTWTFTLKHRLEDCDLHEPLSLHPSQLVTVRVR